MKNILYESYIYIYIYIYNGPKMVPHPPPHPRLGTPELPASAACAEREPAARAEANAHGARCDAGIFVTLCPSAAAPAVTSFAHRLTALAATLLRSLAASSSFASSSQTTEAIQARTLSRSASPIWSTIKGPPHRSMATARKARAGEQRAVRLNHGLTYIGTNIPEDCTRVPPSRF